LKSKQGGSVILLIAVLLLFSAVVFLARRYNYFGLGDVFIIDAAVAAILGVLVIKIVSDIIVMYGRRFGNEINAIKDLFRVFAYVVLLIVVLDILKVNVTGLLVGAGFAGIVIGLAAQNSLSGILAGLQLMSSRPFSVGDRVTISTWQYGLIGPTYQHGEILPAFTGKVNKIGVIYTEIIEEDGTPIYLPNNVVIGALVINHRRTQTKNVSVHVEIAIKKDFSEFKEDFAKLLKRSREARNNVLNLEMRILDITPTSYGVDISALTKQGGEGSVMGLLNRLAVESIRMKK